MSSQSEIEAKQLLRRKADLFRAVFDTPSGKRVLHMLKEEFYLDAEQVMELPDGVLRAKVAQRDVIEYVEKLLEYDRVD